jgi:hypothetical protein
MIKLDRSVHLNHILKSVNVRMVETQKNMKTEATSLPMWSY